jgi:hypothetical protein
MKKYFLIFSLWVILFIPLLVFGQSSSVTESNPAPATQLVNPIGETSPQKLIGKVIQAALGIVGSIALAMFIYGGFVWMMAAGNSEAVTKGKNILIWATLGLIVIFTSYALVQFVFKGLGVNAT